MAKYGYIFYSKHLAYFQNAVIYGLIVDVRFHTFDLKYKLTLNNMDQHLIRSTMIKIQFAIIGVACALFVLALL
jgi:hypothetical protein